MKIRLVKGSSDDTGNDWYHVYLQEEHVKYTTKEDAQKIVQTLIQMLDFKKLELEQDWEKP